MTSRPVTSSSGLGRARRPLDRLRILVLGYIVRGPLGGLAWHHLQYVMGLARIGHDVYFAEDSGDSQWCCYDPTRHVTDADPTYGLEFARQTFERVQLAERWAYYDAHTSRWFGPCADRILDVCASADLLLNLSEVNPLRPWFIKIPARGLVDTDPVFTQIQHLTDERARNLALEHTSFFSFAENIGSDRCTIPDDGLPWQATRQPIVLDAWPVTRGPADGKFTTVMQWDSYAAREYDGVRYGMKSDSFGPYLDLPDKAGPVFELAVGGSTAHDLLAARGWALRNPLDATRDPWAYQRYIQQSKAEFSVAKHGYVVTRTGWFSERSAAYLASGRPALLQETGFSDWLRTGEGVVAFSSPEEALAGIAAIDSRYASHCEAARAVAEQYFDARQVLPRLIERAMNAAPRPVKASAG
jgi:hypothetical protein